MIILCKERFLFQIFYNKIEISIDQLCGTVAIRMHARSYSNDCRSYTESESRLCVVVYPWKQCVFWDSSCRMQNTRICTQVFDSVTACCIYLDNFACSPLHYFMPVMRYRTPSHPILATTLHEQRTDDLTIKLATLLRCVRARPASLTRSFLNQCLTQKRVYCISLTLQRFIMRRLRATVGLPVRWKKFFLNVRMYEHFRSKRGTNSMSSPWYEQSINQLGSPDAFRLKCNVG